ncbi:MAG TPA: xanthine dehydrogenase family protein molybdopterin-binding subunit [Thermoplasmata archaeon]|nr:xanthine dehydrogenase family protein molybdopterin-binding subunit [Thermoplasmata archaeon]
MSGARRPDAEAKVRGGVEFGTDLADPRMLWGALVLAPVAHGTLRSVDLRAARALPGVVAIAADDVAGLVDGAAGDPERPPFATGEVVYRSQPVAAVAAPTLARAREAAHAVRVVVDARPAVADLEALFPEWPGPAAIGSPQVAAHVLARHGDVDRELAGAETVVAETYRTAGVYQVPLEPHACLAEVRDGRWSVRTSTQSPFGVREDVAAILGISEASLDVAGTWVGGGFGGKGASLLEPYALLLARASGRPVRLALSYREEFLLGRSTLPLVARLETGVRGGRIVARRVRLLLDVGTSLPGRDFATGYSIGFLLGPYEVGAFEVEGFAVRTNKPPFGPHRAPMAPQAAFVIESHIASVARAIGADPESFRASHLWSEGATTALGQPVGPFGLGVALDAARARAAAWRATKPPGHGVGVGVGFWSTSTGAGGEARLRLTERELVIEQGEREIGSGSVLVGLVAVASRRTGLPADRIRVEYGDTSHAPFDSGVFGSRTVGALGGAVDDAAVRLLDELGRRLGRSAPVTLAASSAGIVVRADGAEDRPLGPLLTDAERASGGLRSSGRHFGASHAIDERRVVDGSFYAYQDFTGAAHVAEVEVDGATGAVRLVRYAAFQDAGVVLDAAAARAQVEGGVVMGLGAALTEEAVWSEDGRLLNPGLLDYRIPTLGEVPPIEVTFVEGFPGAGPFGAKGLGEPPIVPVPATVAAAVEDAVGIHPTELPLSPERVARAVKAGRPSRPADAARGR